MYLFSLKPYTSGVRHSLRIKKDLLCKSNRLLKKSLVGFKKMSGRSSETGHITVRHKGSGVKMNFRKMLFQDYFLGLVVAISYNPSKNCFLSLNYNLLTGLFFQTPQIEYVGPGSFLVYNFQAPELKLGYRLVLSDVPVGSLINTVSSLKKREKFIKSGGTYGQLIQKSENFCKLKLPSGELYILNKFSNATLGVLSNKQSNKCVLGKAGKSRLCGKRPGVRGVAMNPVDHPHGGRTNGGRPSVTPWGKPTKGRKTKKKN